MMIDDCNDFSLATIDVANHMTEIIAVIGRLLISWVAVSLNFNF